MTPSSPNQWSPKQTFLVCTLFCQNWSFFHLDIENVCVHLYFVTHFIMHTYFSSLFFLDNVYPFKINDLIFFFLSISLYIGKTNSYKNWWHYNNMYRSNTIICLLELASHKKMYIFNIYLYQHGYRSICNCNDIYVAKDMQSNVSIDFCFVSVYFALTFMLESS